MFLSQIHVVAHVKSLITGHFTPEPFFRVVYSSPIWCVMFSVFFFAGILSMFFCEPTTVALSCSTGGCHKGQRSRVAKGYWISENRKCCTFCSIALEKGNKVV